MNKFYLKVCIYIKGILNHFLPFSNSQKNNHIFLIFIYLHIIITALRSQKTMAKNSEKSLDYKKV